MLIFPDSSVGKEAACNAGGPVWFLPWVRKICWRRDRLPTPVFWSGEFHGLYSPWVCKELDTTEWLSLSHVMKWSEVKSLNRVRLFATPWTVAYQDPQSMAFSRQGYWSGLPFPSEAEYKILREFLKVSLRLQSSQPVAVPQVLLPSPPQNWFTFICPKSYSGFEKPWWNESIFFR